MKFRIGINLGDVMSDGERIYGDGINISARIQALAEPGGICISDLVYKQINDKERFTCFDLGEQTLKNIPEPVRVYRLVDAQSDVSDAIPDKASKRRPALKPPAKPSLAVLPFVNLSNDPDQDHFSDGLTLDIMTALVSIPGLFLISDLSTFGYKSTTLSVRELGRQLGVTHVLDGGVRRVEDRVRVTARLVETTAGRQIWAERYDRNLSDIFAIQDDITDRIVTAMDVQLVSGEPARTVHGELKNSQAIESYYQGWSALFRSTKEDLIYAQQRFEETIRLEPASSLGYVLAAWTYWWAVSKNVSDHVADSLKRATELAQQALRMQDVTGLADLVLAEIHLLNKEHDEALAAAERAVLARPSCDISFAVKASLLNYLGRPAEAIELAQYAIRLTPVYPSYYSTVLATAYLSCGRYEEAISAAQVSLDANADDLDGLLVVAAANAALGRIGQAEEAGRTARHIKPDFSLESYAAKQPYKDARHLEQMLGMLKKAGL